MRSSPLLAFISIGFLAGCSATLKPKIRVDSATAPDRLLVTGSGFSPTASCATLSVWGMPSGPPGAKMGAPTACTSGGFRGFTWKYEYVSGCNATTPQPVTVIAIDNPTLDPAAASTSILWGPNCAFAGTCGDLGQYPCPAGCLQGSVSNTTGQCSCGAQGQLECTSGTKCQSGLTPVRQGSSSVCQPCGGGGQPVCDSGNKCQSNLTSQQGTCVPCGQQGQPVCDSGDKCQSNLTSQQGTCVPCGQQGQPVCASGNQCQPNLTPIQQGSSTKCQPCGGEQQPLCAAGDACQTGLHSQLEGANNLVCEVSCGYGAGVPCTPAMVAAGMGVCAGAPPVVESPQMPCITEKNGQSLYRCFDSAIAPNCICQQGNSCKESASLGSCSVPGVCTN